MKRIVIFGAGISGLSAAHELIKLGYQVEVYESLGEAGGFFRSARLEENKFTPSEYSWHGLGPWYHNAFDIMKEIPFNEESSVFDEALSKPMDFGIAPSDKKAEFYDHGLIHSVPKMFQMTRWDWVKWGYLMLKVWTSNKRSHKHYATLNAAKEWEKVLSPKASATWRACFGPWVGSDYSRVSLHHCAHFFRKQLLGKEIHQHKTQGGWSHQAGDNWLLLRGPSSEVWFEPWVKFLTNQGVKFHFNKSLEKLHLQNGKIHSAQVSGQEVKGDIFILALNPYFTAKILEESQELLRDPELGKFSSLTKDSPHVQVSWRMSFGDKILWPRERCAVVLSDTEWNLTMFAQEQAWREEIELGEEVKSLWTGTACIDSIKGKNKKELRYCTKEEFSEEVKRQVFSCQGLNELIKEANGGKELRDFSLLNFEVWHEWKFKPSGFVGLQPKWVTSMNTQAHLPLNKTSISNLTLAGAHCKTQADVWSIEGAVESGRRAAQVIDPKVKVKGQHTSFFLKVISKIDDFLYERNLPQVLDLSMRILFVIGLVLFL